MWFSVEDRLPCTDEDVIVTDGNLMCIAYNDACGEWVPANVEPSYDMSNVQLSMNTITHWMDLPSLPL